MDDGRLKTRCGKFGYETLEDGVHIPYIFRNDEIYCATKIFAWHLEQQANKISGDFIDFRYLKGYEMYRDEADLMNEINCWHNNAIYPFLFTRTETLIQMEDVRNIFKFMHDCSQKSKYGADYQMAAGMVQIQFSAQQSQIIWPYVEADNIKYIPVDVLDKPRTLSTTIMLSGIDLMYMRYLLSILHLEIPSKNFQLSCVVLDEALAHLLSETDENFEYDDNYWPTKDGNHKQLNNNHLPSFMAAHTNNSTMEQSVQDNQIEKIPSRKRRNVKKTTKQKTRTNPHFYDVDHLVDYKRHKNGKEMVLVHWRGYSSEYDSWQPVTNLNEALQDDLNELRYKSTTTK